MTNASQLGVAPGHAFFRITVLLITLTVVAVLPAGVKQTTFNPYAAPDNGELDRLQKIINDRPDLEVVQAQLTAPSTGDWSEIAADLDPILKAAGFKPNTPPGVTPPQGNASYIRDDGAIVGNSPAVLIYSYSTGCHLPAAWRTGRSEVRIAA